MAHKLQSFRLSPRAQQDLETIWLYSFKKWSPAQADSYVSDLLSGCEGLVSRKRIGSPADEIRAGYSKYFSGSHVIFYKISGEFLDVVRILHQSMDVESNLEGSE